ncbi:MAG: hypothetical protein CMJ78_27800 [Planctomycetaceae bacterium]|nr:hypothetical protein [Planctomycetaceae bacterium]
MTFPIQTRPADEARRNNQKQRSSDDSVNLPDEINNKKALRFSVADRYAFKLTFTRKHYASPTALTFWLVMKKGLTPKTT